MDRGRKGMAGLIRAVGLDRAAEIETRWQQAAWDGQAAESFTPAAMVVMAANSNSMRKRREKMVLRVEQSKEGGGELI